MHHPGKNLTPAVLLSLPLLLGQQACGANGASGADSDFLWQKLNQQCVPNYLADDIYRPCALVDLDSRYVIYKVDNDKYQYLLLPTDKISGIEDPQLLNDQTSKYFYHAWQARSFLTEKLNKTLKEKDIALTLNAANTRTQNQLHFHISCLAPAVRTLLNGLDTANLGNEWSALAEKIRQHTYYVKKISLSDLKTINLFPLIKDKVTADHGQMAYSGAALVNVNKDTFLLLVSSGTAERGVAAEEIQDHQCRMAY
ncbi:CDP-diacylglycerol diphosphatase [Paraburkholderia hayleyella]|uniref:CDP-diacylglycerol diphosphatase n=1 Tax=Paraburkholderia hayleyella TaxID=2152889 RepID=UPI001580E956|nr:CDP-diacylglycerol diphosphatase [Paraburkholderia hayleyella]